ncbi:MAG TPA: NDP-sugar synthase [Candidatus Binataceae bacterium]|nr:NDP-sugar synthase [Candidatus Binataceae bacterium]
MRALVLSAGVGERLKPLTNTVPKPLVEIGGRPLIHYPILMLKRAGITEIAINAHHLAGTMQSTLKNGADLGVDIIWAPEPSLLGTGGPLNGLRGFLGGGTFVVANSDTILDFDLAEAIAFHRDRGALVTIAVAHPANLNYYSRIELDNDARIRRMLLLKSRSPLAYDDYSAAETDAAALEPFMYCGVIVAEPQVFDLIPPSPPWSMMNGLIAPMVRDGLPVMGFIHRGFMRTVDDLTTYEAVRAEFAASPPPLRFLNDPVD